jgi:hypothetical protein
VGRLCAAEPSARADSKAAMTTLTTVIFTNVVVCFVALVLNFMMQKTVLLKWLTCGLLTLAILLLVITYIVAHK